MTLPAHSEPFGGKMPSASDRQIANQLCRILAAQKSGEATLRVREPETNKRVEVTLTPAVSDIFRELLRHIGSGHAVTLVPIQEKLTTQQAADLLNVSRPHLIKLLEQDAIPHTFVGRHRRIKAENIFGYKVKRDEERARALDALISNEADMIDTAPSSRRAQ
jgi:excisionase family DNA binding protein